jgi:hypothetical protein
VVPAIKKPCRHHVARLEILIHQLEYLPQVGKHGAGELIDQEGTARGENRMGLAKNGFPKLCRHRGVRDAGKYVICMAQVQRRKHGIGIGGGPMDDMEAVILEALTQKLYEVGVGLEHHQHGVGPHPAENLGGEGPHTRSVLEEDASAAPIDLGQYVVDEESRAGNQAPQHTRMLEEVATEEQELSGTRGALWGHVETLDLSRMSVLRLNVAGAGKPAPPSVHR